MTDRSPEQIAADYPDLDYEALAQACIYALQQFVVADSKESDAPMSAEEHRSMGYRRLREAMQVKPP